MTSPVLIGGTGRPILRNGKPLSTCGALQQGVVASASATTIYAGWATGSASDTVLAAGTSPGTFNIAAADAGTQTSVAAHSGIIAGLTPGTRYFCRATSGGAEIARFEITTLAAATSTPLTGCAFSAATKFNNPPVVGDTFHNCIASDGRTYTTACDNAGFGGTAPANTVMTLGVFDTEVPPPLHGSNVNFFTGYAAVNQAGLHSPKFSGIFSDRGVLYGAMAQQNNTAQPFSQHGGQIIKSPDLGVTWSNYQGGSSTSGPTTTPFYANMFSGATTIDQTFASPAFVMYGADNNDLGYRVHNADAYAYLISNDGYWDNGGKLYLARVAKGKLPLLRGSDYQYWTGGDGTLDANWSSSYASAASIIGSQVGKIGVASIQYLPALNRYLLFTWYYPDASNVANSVWVIYESPTPWGTWTQINSTTMSGFGWYNPSVLMRSALGNVTANGLTLLMSGNYTGGPSIYYALYTCSMSLQT